MVNRLFPARDITSEYFDQNSRQGGRPPWRLASREPFGPTLSDPHTDLVEDTSLWRAFRDALVEASPLFGVNAHEPGTLCEGVT
ncbi:MAG: hypothetical protein A2847_02080 [Candidatus Sungbacteria bacterium RIFCSPHIGHO2_01_FULL_50_25]|uniref:Uncharacterized protein n=1 Tax=Candidatus Sungbacteria bacterium RIFCSPHIGHO2_01_FULL_50_25 TaxID=1802265 RepID=A0A1G2K956_9BACT|nr:MAG: hypothetical protein A2847_02080 [Candidatus Sungbacteria bacterium RIFCSPHIGHO2_01_FULL_50_25]